LEGIYTEACINDPVIGTLTLTETCCRARYQSKTTLADTRSSRLCRRLRDLVLRQKTKRSANATVTRVGPTYTSIPLSKGLLSHVTYARTARRRMVTENSGLDARLLQPSRISTRINRANRRTTAIASSGRRPRQEAHHRSWTSSPHHPAPAQRRWNRIGLVPNRPRKPAVTGLRRGVVSSQLHSTRSTGRSIQTPATRPGTAARWGTEVVIICPATPGATLPGYFRIWISAERSAPSPPRPSPPEV